MRIDDMVVPSSIVIPSSLAATSTIPTYVKTFVATTAIAGLHFVLDVAPTIEHLALHPINGALHALLNTQGKTAEPLESHHWLRQIQGSHYFNH